MVVRHSLTAPSAKNALPEASFTADHLVWTGRSLVSYLNWKSSAK